jgi:histidinol-phosphate/aromatic aminotransferase/cobyric acid decarboxylase-like protein
VGDAAVTAAESRLRPSPAAAHGGRSPLPVDLSASLNPLGPSRPALAAARAAELGRYPDASAAPLALAAAARHRLPVGAVVPIPGAGWALWFCLVAFGGPGRRCVALGPCFGEYRRAAEIAGCRYEETAEGLERALASRPDVLLLANPSNPAAGALPADVVAAACAASPGTLLVVDEAFAAFAPAGTSLVEGRVPPANAIVVRSLTKELGLPGLRMGYLVAIEERAAALAAALPAWPLSAPAVAAGAAGCADEAHIRAGADVGRRHVRLLADALARAGAEVCPSAANYLLCRAPGLVERLAGRGIAARDCASFGLPGHARLAAPAPADLPAVLEALDG